MWFKRKNTPKQKTEEKKKQKQLRLEQKSRLLHAFLCSALCPIQAEVIRGVKCNLQSKGTSMALTRCWKYRAKAIPAQVRWGLCKTILDIGTRPRPQLRPPRRAGRWHVQEGCLGPQLQNTQSRGHRVFTAPFPAFLLLAAAGRECL